MTKRFLLTFLCVLLLVYQGFAQSVRITGTVTSAEDGETVPGATVLVVGTGNGTITDVEGNFSLNAASSDSIRVSYIGYETVVLPVGNRTQINITLYPDIERLEEVIVVGYGTQKRSDVTGSVASFSGDVLEKMPTVDVTQALQGRVAGLNVTFSGSSAEGGNSNMLIRGKNSLTADNKPFIVLDGIPFESGSLSEINPNDIESVNILKDASATAIYGARAANGVILITTKKGA